MFNFFFFLANTARQVLASISIPSKTNNEQQLAYRTLASVPPFSYLPKEELKRLVLDLFKIEYNDGEAIVGQDNDDDDVYILKQGRIAMIQLQLQQQQQQVNNVVTSATKSIKKNNVMGSNWRAKFAGYKACRQCGLPILCIGYGTSLHFTRIFKYDRI